MCNVTGQHAALILLANHWQKIIQLTGSMFADFIIIQLNGLVCYYLHSSDGLESKKKHKSGQQHNEQRYPMHHHWLF